MHTINFPLGIVVIFVKYSNTLRMSHNLSPVDPRQLLSFNEIEICTAYSVSAKFLSKILRVP